MSGEYPPHPHPNKKGGNHWLFIFLIAMQVPALIAKYLLYNILFYPDKLYFCKRRQPEVTWENRRISNWNNYYPWNKYIKLTTKTSGRVFGYSLDKCLCYLHWGFDGRVILTDLLHAHYLGKQRFIIVTFQKVCTLFLNNAFQTAHFFISEIHEVSVSQIRACWK